MKITILFLMLILGLMSESSLGQDPVYNTVDTQDYTIGTDTSEYFFDNEAFILSIENFEKQRSAGKVLQFVGVIGSTLLSALAMKKDNDIRSQHFIAAGGFYLVGFAIDLGAGKHLRELKSKALRKR